MNMQNDTSKNLRKRAIVRLVSSVDLLRKTSQATLWMYGHFSDSRKTFKRFLKKKIAELPIEEAATQDSKNIKKLLARENVYAELIRKQSLVYIVGIFEHTLRRAYEACLFIKPELLKEKQINVEVLFKDSKAIERARNEKVEGVAKEKIHHKEFSDTHTLFTSSGIQFPFSIPVKEIEEFFYRRHLVLHNASIVDQKYISKSFGTGKKIGNKITVPKKYLSRAALFLFVYADLLKDNIRKL